MNWPVLVQLGRVAARTRWVYRTELVFYIVAVLLQVYLLKMVWRAVYAGRASIEGLELDVLVAYVTMANLQLWLLSPLIAGFVHQRIREGQVAVDLARPVGFIRQLLAYQVGLTVAEVPFVLLGLPFGFLVGGLQPPASASAAGLYVLSLGLAYAILVLTSVLLGLIAFWTLELTGMLAIYRLVSSFFAGGFMPLSFFPPGLRAVADVLPFQTQAYLPLGLYFGRLTGGEALRAIGLEVFWVAALSGLARLAWQRTIRHVIVQGG